MTGSDRQHGSRCSDPQCDALAVVAAVAVVAAPQFRGIPLVRRRGPGGDAGVAVSGTRPELVLLLVYRR